MFYLRPHGRHERVSQEESEAADNNTAANNNSSSDNSQNPPIRQSDLQSALAAAGIESIHQQQPSSAPSAATADSLSDENPAANNLNNNDPSNITDDSTSPASASVSSEREADQYYHSATTGAPSSSEPNTATISPFGEHYQQQHHPTMIRTSPTCFLLICFFLLRLWIEAIIEKDIGLVFISLMGTTWCYRWYALRREAEMVWMESATDNELTIEEGGGGVNTSATNTGSNNRGGADAAVDFDPDLGLMSFQAQLAMAILESQRQMFENGGYGGNDNPSSENGPGVTDEAKQSWTRYEWGKCDETTEKLRAVIHKSDSKTKIGGEGGDYGSVSMEDKDNNNSEVQSVSSSSQQPAEMMNEDSASSSTLSKLEEGGLLMKSLEEEEPSCSICLCEYENGDTVTKLPCNHIYHESCLSSWTDSHVRCPLCNYDLMTGFEQPESVRNQQNNEVEQLAFRNMALSALGGRRVRARVTSARRANPGGWSRRF